MNTIKSDIKLIERQIEYHHKDINAHSHRCAFCEVTYGCGNCILVRRFNKSCSGYPTYRNYMIEFYLGGDLKTAIRNRIKSLRRMIKKIKVEKNRNVCYHKGVRITDEVFNEIQIKSDSKCL